MIGTRLTSERPEMPDKAAKIDGSVETARFKDITFEDYGRRAIDPTLSQNEKVGFPDAFRDGHAETIWLDLVGKLPSLTHRGSRVLDIGCGCGHLPQKLIQHAALHEQRLTMIDHPNMLAQLQNVSPHRLIPGRFPSVVEDIPDLGRERFDVVICYSVLHGLAREANPFYFVDAAVELLEAGGQLIFGDIPNFSKLRRFLASEKGKAYHRDYMKSDSDPDIPLFAIDKERLDDGFLLGLLTHLRMGGLDAYLLPQPPSLPLSTRREDLLVLKS
jgi:2-polyprenyl-3-methyl-5-hydroxy-6-metoxy-1,4-benzoquinol methylase